ncbi:hypothetical protein BKA04_002132 [Cryobacterium mesophilum]|uniref:Amylopullulanase X25 domain-containing protein n=1 Tax=Terrimesophilobacter mesophilus TaxID=433647 RepID=A0A4R8VEH9_9MICO|nr:hypothetical protein [Terrimesophilobacter mesophilus]MBB5633909.1 hypothetical protein [Terrimesophilobacter mesophilus]TFB80580.1 hypothetical protein E3N84_11375 [Terrimesophilobacter mesophilus]
MGSRTHIRPRVTLAVLALAAPLLALAVASPATAAPANVSVPGDFNSEIGCGSDWDPSCAQAQLTGTSADELWTMTVSIPAGTWSYNIYYDSTYGPTAGQRTFTLAATTAVTFYYNAFFDRFGSSAEDVIVTAFGDFQSEIGCTSDWDSSCARSALFLDSTGAYSLVESSLPAGSYQTKVWHDFGAGAVYGDGGDSPGSNIFFSVLADQTVIFKYDLPTHVLTVTAESPEIVFASPTVAAGGTLTATVSGFVPGEIVEANLDGTPIFTGAVDEFGHASFSATIAPGSPAGAATVTATGAMSDRVATQGLMITAVAALAETGVDFVPLGLPGALLLAAGAVAMFARRRYARTGSGRSLNNVPANGAK